MLTTSPQGNPCNVITVNRSFFTAASSAASADAAKDAAIKITTQPGQHLRIASPGSTY
jgi:hypothetical protein